MSLSARIATHLAFLRRYARAVAGSQTSGDAYVAATLEALIADVSAFPEASSDRVALFKLFTMLFGSTTVDLPEAESPFAWEQRAQANLQTISPRARQAFLLVSIEGFTSAEAAEILGTDSEEFSELIDQAAGDISRQIATEVMIIEDEPLIAMDIEEMVSSLGHSITGIARTHKEATKLFAEKTPGLILADIQLADGSSGIEAVNDILKVSSIPVIFITAFPERLLTGERPEPAFIVTKPFNPDMVKALISQALFFRDVATEAA
ncbi:response regulator [Tepidamorphus sp. 3E244]|uniref:response regulator n=1 Tax=Tepidamorphus sp. 3E244 TaxID=3385498 RepID=UPI0038FC24D9